MKKLRISNIKFTNHLHNHYTYECKIEVFKNRCYCGNNNIVNVLKIYKRN